MSPIAGLVGLGGSNFQLFDGRLNLDGLVIQFTGMDFYVYTAVPSNNSVQNLQITGKNVTNALLYAGDPIDMSTATLLHRNVPYGSGSANVYQVFEASSRIVRVNFYNRTNVATKQFTFIQWDHPNEQGLLFNICKGENENGRSSSSNYGQIKHRNFSNRGIGQSSNTTGANGCTLSPYFSDDSYAIRLVGKIYSESETNPGVADAFLGDCYCDLGIDGPNYVTSNNKYAFVNTYQAATISQQLYTYSEILDGIRLSAPPAADATIS